jgi:PiT family inorganic phosphate transporter
MTALAWLIVGLGLTFAFLNGMNDSGTLAAAMICTGAVGPRKALLLVAGSQVVGALAAGVAVAYTVGRGIVVPGAITGPVVVAALVASVAWNALASLVGLPSSSSHALVGALAGAAWAAAGRQAVLLGGIARVLLVLFIAPWVGFVATYGVMKALLWALAGSTPKAGARLERAQWLLVPLVAAGHGANDGQKSMGIIALGLFAAGVLPTFAVPGWVRWVAALALATGTTVGGMRILRTVGLKLYRIRAIHGFASQAATALVVLVASLLGNPVSTTQVLSAGIAGAGSAQRFSQVRWGVIVHIVMTWFLTVPGAGGLAALVYWLIWRF